MTKITYFLALTLLEVIFFKISVSSIQAKLYINEILPNPSGEDKNNEWIEIYNDGENSDLSLYKLVDKAGNEINIEQNIVNGDIKIGKGEWRVITAAGKFSINNSDETIYLTLKDKTITEAEDSYTYEKSKDNMSWGRVPDGKSFASQMLIPTKGNANSAPPSKIPKPTKTPFPNLDNPQPTELSSEVNFEGNKNSIINPSPYIKENKKTKTDKKIVLGIQNTQPPESTPSGSITVTEDNKEKFPITAVLFSGAGISFASGAGYIFYKSKREEIDKD